MKATGKPDLIKQFQHLSTIFSTFNRAQRKSFVDNLTNDQAKWLIELAMNAYFKTINLNSSEIKALEKYKNKIKRISNSRLSFKKKKKLMTGGFVGTLLATAAQALIPLLLENVLGNINKNKDSNDE